MDIAIDVDIIQNIFENMNIYQSIVLFSKKHIEHALRIADVLSQHDYPVKVYTPKALTSVHTDDVAHDKMNFRMFFVPFDELLYFFELWDEEIYNINFMIFLGRDVKNKYDQVALTFMSRFKFNTNNLITYVVPLDA